MTLYTGTGAIRLQLAVNSTVFIINSHSFHRVIREFCHAAIRSSVTFTTDVSRK
jgi:hypothetical protein